MGPPSPVGVPLPLSEAPLLPQPLTTDAPSAALSAATSKTFRRIRILYPRALGVEASTLRNSHAGHVLTWAHVRVRRPSLQDHERRTRSLRRGDHGCGQHSEQLQTWFSAS